MKNAIITFVLSILAAISLHAQEGEIIYTDYGPDGWSYEFDRMGPDNFDTLQIDLDNDGLTDVFYRGLAWSLPAPCIPDVILCSKFGESQPYCFYVNFYIDSEGGYIFTETYGDTLSADLTWSYRYTFKHALGEYVDRPNPRYVGLRLPHENGGYCYGWLEQSIEWIKYPEIPGDYWGYYYNGLVKVFRWAYCTIPDYPLRVGQTSFNWDDLEETTTAVFTLHPNPTNGQVTITGKDLKQVEVFNTLGQNVATVHGEGERITLDISALPAGIYFVNVTDEDGKKCVRKVVKQ